MFTLFPHLTLRFHLLIMLIAYPIPAVFAELKAMLRATAIVMYTTVMMIFVVVGANLSPAWIRAIFDCA